MKRRIVPYNAVMKSRARVLRNNSTLSEILLWQQLKGRQMRGYDFHRQKPINNYIVDFYCNELMLAIEIDGSSHDDRFDEDQKRQDVIEQHGVSFLRFSDRSVKRELQSVVDAIAAWIDEHEEEIRGYDL